MCTLTSIILSHPPVKPRSWPWEEQWWRRRPGWSQRLQANRARRCTVQWSSMSWSWCTGWRFGQRRWSSPARFCCTQPVLGSPLFWCPWSQLWKTHTRTQIRVGVYCSTCLKRLLEVSDSEECTDANLWKTLSILFSFPGRSLKKKKSCLIITDRSSVQKWRRFLICLRIIWHF